MLNIPLVEKQSIEVEQKINEKSEKLSIFEKIEYRQIIKKNYWKATDNISVNVVKSSIDGTFSIIIKNIRQTNKKVFLSINNKIN